MKLLILTQKADKSDPVLGFFQRWIEEFSKHYEKVTVICLEKGKVDVPHNVRILSLGKEEGVSRMTYSIRFYRYIWQYRKEYDNVFVHMNPEYIVLGGLLWKIFNKKIVLWYTHRQVNMKLRIATFFADTIFSSSKESFGIGTSKVHYVGHGIATGSFQMAPVNFGRPLIGMHIGRITKIKHIDTILRAVKIMREKGVALQTFCIVGAPVTVVDNRYKTELESLIKGLGLEKVIIFEGPKLSPEALAEATFTINAAPDGGMDKVVLESLAAGRPVFASNRAFEGVFGPYAPIFMFTQNDAADLAEKIALFNKLPERDVIVKYLSEKVQKEFDVSVLIQKIVTQLA